VVSTSISLPLTPPTPAYRDARGFLDAMLAYKFSNGIEVFAEGRNLGNKSTTNSNGHYAQFSQGPALLDTTYNGRRYMAGMNLRF
jgi:outer membrane receptor for ferrienterochelin and colicin